MTPKLQIAFSLGLKVAEHVHGFDRKRNQAITDAMFKVLDQVAKGEITLLDTPEETIASLPAPPDDVTAKAPDALKKLQDQLQSQMPEMTRRAMRDHREVANELLKDNEVIVAI